MTNGLIGIYREYGLLKDNPYDPKGLENGTCYDPKGLEFVCFEEDLDTYKTTVERIERAQELIEQGFEYARILKG